MKALVANTKPGDEIVFCYSGHGAPAGRPEPSIKVRHGTLKTSEFYAGVVTVDDKRISPQVCPLSYISRDQYSMNVAQELNSWLVEPLPAGASLLVRSSLLYNFTECELCNYSDPFRCESLLSWAFVSS